jgi:hypothetical protein
VDPHHLPHRDGEHPVGIIPAQVLLRREGEPGKVGERPDVLGGDPFLVELLPVIGNMGVDPVERRLQALDLELFEILAVHALPVLLPVHRLSSLKV